MNEKQLKRIADAIEEILRLVKKDMEPKKKMTNIIYKDKKHKLPFEIKSHSTTMVKRTNGLSGQSTELPQFAALVYDHTMYMSMMTEMKDKETKQTPGFSEHQDDWQIVRNGINFFRQYFAKEYMVLLD